MPPHQGFTDSDIAFFRHETDRSSGQKKPPGPMLEEARRLLRSKPNPRDASMSEMTVVWLLRLPEHIRPLALCEQFPRIANRIALCWDDPKLTAIVLQELLTDRRGNRRGYTAEVKSELQVLLGSVRF